MSEKLGVVLLTLVISCTLLSCELVGIDPVTPGLEYSVRSLGNITEIAVGINAAGQVAVNGREHAFIWDERFGLQSIGTLGGPFASGEDINEIGQIVGVSSAPDALSRPFIWEDGSMEEIGIPGGMTGTATAINNLGRAVGHYSNHPRIPFMWTHEEGVTIIPLDCENPSVHDINDHGQVVGRCPDRGAFLWSEEDGMIELGTLGGQSSNAYAVNNLGQVVGQANDDRGDFRSFLWEEDTGMIDITRPGYTFSVTWDINDRGEAVGWHSRPDLDVEYEPFLRRPNGAFVDLPVLPEGEIPSGSSPMAINNLGVAAGYSNYRDERNAAIWSPRSKWLAFGE